MNAHVSREFYFLSGIYFEDTFLINSYDIDLDMDVLTESIEEQNIALERIKFLFNACLENSIMVNSKHKHVIDNYIKAGLKVCTLADEPYDQIVAATLIRKLNNISEGRLFVNEIKIRSAISDNVSFYISSDDEVDCLNVKNAWWSDSTTNISDKAKRENKKVLELKRDSCEWAVMGLTWKQKSEEPKSNDIVYINRDK